MMNLFSEAFVSMLVRFLVCFCVNLFIVDRLYYRKSKRRDFYFTFMLSSIAIFFLVFFMIFVLEDLKTKTSIGIGIGLFGIFSIMRYRTDAMPVREMTYLFVIIALSVVNAIAASVSIIELLITNLLVIVAIAWFEHRLKIIPTKLVQYDRLELIKPERYEEMKNDLEKRLGVKIIKVEVGAVDMLRDMAMLKVYYVGESYNSVDDKLKIKLILLITLLLPSQQMMAQNNEWGLWTSASVEKKINKLWSVEAEGELRTRNDFKTIDRWSGGVEVNYKVASFLALGAGYTILYDNNIEKISWHDDGTPNNWRPSYWGLRHRFNVDATLKHSIGRMRLSLRERWQYTYRPEKSTERYDFDNSKWEEKCVNGKAKHLLRSRLQIDYNLKKSKIDPFASVELFNGWNVQKVRYSIGADWKLSKKHSVGMGYRYQTTDDDDNNEPDRHILNVGYKYKF